MSALTQPRFCDLDAVMKEIDQAYTKKFTYTIVKKKKNRGLDYTKFTAQEGLIKFPIKLAPTLICYCDSPNITYCPHILKILTEYFRLSPELISYLHVPEILSKLSDLLKSTEPKIHYNNILLHFLHKHFSDDCGICCDPLSYKKYKMRLFKCDSCSRYVHTVCMEQWYRQKSKLPDGTRVSLGQNGCIYCREKP